MPPDQSFARERAATLADAIKTLHELDQQLCVYVALTEQDETIAHHVNEGMRRLEREIRQHAGSNLLHSGGPNDVT